MRRNTCGQNDKFEVNSETISQKIYVTTELQSHLPEEVSLEENQLIFLFFPLFFKFRCSSCSAFLLAFGFMFFLKLLC